MRNDNKKIQIIQLRERDKYETQETKGGKKVSHTGISEWCCRMKA